jgi:hypothetical protein
MDAFGGGIRVPSVRVHNSEPGDEAQVYFGCVGMMHDAMSGKSRKLWAPVVCLSHSRYAAVYPTRQAQQPERLCRKYARGDFETLTKEKA